MWTNEKRLLAGMAVAAVLAPSPAAAVPWQAGDVDRGWVKTECFGTATDQTCVVKVVGPAKRFRTKYVHGGDRIAVEVNYPRQPGPYGDRPRAWMGPVPGVSVICEGRGGRVLCEVKFDQRVSDFDVTLRAGGTMVGGVTGTGVS